MKKTLTFIFIAVFTVTIKSQPLINGGFENGYNGWTAYSQAGDDIVGTAAFFASSSITPAVNTHGGAKMARLGGFGYNVNYVKQVVTLPISNPVKLELYYQTRSSNTSECAGLYVGAKICFVVSGTVITENYLCYYNDVLQWTYGYYDLTAIAGQTVEIKYTADAANSVWSYIYLDDMIITPSTVDIESTPAICDASLEQNYPNPFSENTTITYSVVKQGKVSLIIYNLAGREVLRVFDENKNPGDYNATITGLNLTPGTYYYKLTSDDNTLTQKMIVLK